MRRFETLIAAVNGSQGDAAIASITATLDMRAKVDFTDSYYRTTARVVTKRDSPIDDPLPERLEGKKVAVVAGTAHEAYLKALFTEVELRAIRAPMWRAWRCGEATSICCSAMRSRSPSG